MSRWAVLLAMGILLSGTSSPAQGIVRAEGRHLVGEDGQPFLVVGHNEGLDWPFVDAMWKLPPAEADEAVGEYFARMAADGVNTIRLFAEYPHTGIYLQNPDGSLVEENWRRLEHLLDIADRHGIYVLIGPYDPFWTERHWDRDPLNAKNGGPMERLGDFFTSPAAREHQRKRLLAMVERLGHRRNILAWELLNEADFWWHPNPADVDAWFTEMASLVESEELRLFGRRHLITLSAGRPVPDSDWSALLTRHPRAEIVSTHLYVHGVADPKSPVAAARQVRDAMSLILEQIGDLPRPYLETENGPYDTFVERKGEHLDATFDARVYMAVCWAHVAAGGAGQPMRWPYRIPHTLTDDMRRVQRVQAGFFGRFPFGDFDPAPLAAILSSPGAEVVAIGDAKRAIAFAVREESEAGEWSLLLPHAINGGEARLEVLDPWTGVRGESRGVALDDSRELVVALPSELTQVVVSLWRESMSPEDEKAPTAMHDLALSVEGPPPGSPVRVELWNPRWGRQVHEVSAGEAQSFSIPGGEWRARAWADGFLPQTVAGDPSRDSSALRLALEPWTPPAHALHASGLDDASGLAFWSPVRLAGERDGRVAALDGTLEIVNPNGSRFGASSPRLSLCDGDSVAFEGVLESVDGYNAIVCLLGGITTHNDFVEFDVCHDLLNVWTDRPAESRRFVPSTVRPPVLVRVEASRAGGSVSVRCYHDGRLIHEMSDVSALRDSEDVAVFLYGWNATVRWATTQVEGRLSKETNGGNP